MRIKFGTMIVIAGFAGLQSFSFLLAALGSDYWYIIEVKNPNQTHSGELNSHSGLWRMYEALCVAYMEFQVPPVVFQGVLTLSGVTLYLSYSQQALEELQRQVGSEHLAYVRVYFGWSLGLAWLSFILEILTGTLLLLAARITCLQCHREPANTTMA